MPAALLIFILSALASAQDTPEAESFKREIKLDVLMSFESTLKIGYEYWLNNRNSMAFSAFYNFSSKPEHQTQALLGYKLYFIKFKKLPWLFVESNLGYTKGYRDVYIPYVYNGDTGIGTGGEYVRSDLKYNSFTTGLSLGIKFFMPETSTGLEALVGIYRMYGKKEWELAPNYGISIVRTF